MGWKKAEIMIAVNEVSGGPDVQWCPISMAIRDVVRQLSAYPAETKDGDTKLLITFHVPGSVYAPDWEGLRLQGFSVKTNTLRTKIAVPREYAIESPAGRYVVEQVEASVSAGRNYSGRNAKCINLVGIEAALRWLKGTTT